MAYCLSILFLFIIMVWGDNTITYTKGNEVDSGSQPVAPFGCMIFLGSAKQDKSRANVEDVTKAGDIHSIIDVLEQKLGDLILALERKATVIKELETKLIALDARIGKSESELNKKESEIKECMSSISAQAVKQEGLTVELNETKSDLGQMKTRISVQDEKIAQLKQKASLTNIIVDTLQIGRWRLEMDKSDDALLLRDTKGNDRRYKFPAGGRSDMYTDGAGGDIFAKRIVFPNRWSIGEEQPVNQFLVFRDRGAPGRDVRYAMTANRYRDL